MEMISAKNLFILIVLLNFVACNDQVEFYQKKTQIGIAKEIDPPEYSDEDADNNDDNTSDASSSNDETNASSSKNHGNTNNASSNNSDPNTKPSKDDGIISDASSSEDESTARSSKDDGTKNDGSSSEDESTASSSKDDGTKNDGSSSEDESTASSSKDDGTKSDASSSEDESTASSSKDNGTKSDASSSEDESTASSSKNDGTRSNASSSEDESTASSSKDDSTKSDASSSEDESTASSSKDDGTNSDASSNEDESTASSSKNDGTNSNASSSEDESTASSSKDDGTNSDTSSSNDDNSNDPKEDNNNNQACSNSDLEHIPGVQGTGNNGNGVGNTGTGNQGNDKLVGNAGGCRNTASNNDNKKDEKDDQVKSPQNELQFEEVKEVFFQNDYTRTKVDILWVIDDSGSMRDEQNDLAANFDAFIHQFIQNDVDFRMGITTTDGYGNKNGKNRVGSEQLTLKAYQDDPNQFFDDFSNNIKVGVKGSGTEQGIKTSAKFLSRYEEEFLRDDAYLVIIYVSDENDHSRNSVSKDLALIQSFKNSKGLFKAYSIVTHSLKYSYSSESIGTKYMEMSKLTGGKILDIQDDFSSSLQDLGQNIVDLIDKFSLAGVPVDEEVSVKVNNVDLKTGWLFDANSRTIQFDENDLPAVGSKIEISYKRLKE